MVAWDFLAVLEHAAVRPLVGHLVVGENLRTGDLRPPKRRRLRLREDSTAKAAIQVTLRNGRRRHWRERGQEEALPPSLLRSRTIPLR